MHLSLFATPFGAMGVTLEALPQFFKSCGSIQPLGIPRRCDWRYIAAKFQLVASPVVVSKSGPQLHIFLFGVPYRSRRWHAFGCSERYRWTSATIGCMPAQETVLRRVAFDDAPDIADCSLMAMATAADAPAAQLLAAIVLGARGRYASASTLLDPLIRGRNPLLAALGGTVLASHRRQLGGHRAALTLDGAALRRAVHASGPADEDGLDFRGATADALLGLAADNLALGRLGAARRLLDRAVALAAGWRAEVRAGWVEAELALAAATPQDAVLPAKRALGIARDRGAVRHSIKSELVLSAALAATGEPEGRRRAAHQVHQALEAARMQGWRSLVWPAEVLAADLDPGQAEQKRRRVSRELHDLLLDADPVGRRLACASPWIPV